MMKLFKYELFKIITKSIFWELLVSAFIVNILALFWLNQPAGLNHAETKEMYNILRSMELNEKLNWIEEEQALMDAYMLKTSLTNQIENDINDEYTLELQEKYNLAKECFGEKLNVNIKYKNAQAQKELMENIKNDLTVNTFFSYLDEIDDEADNRLNSSIFGDDSDSFPSRNIVKTKSDFNDMRNVEIRYDVNEGLSCLFNSPSTDIIILLMIIAICIALITDEKDKRLFVIIKSTPNGTLRTITAKLGAMAVCIFGVNTLLFLSNIVFAELIYGLGDISRSIQSVPMFMGSTMRLTVLSFIILYFLTKTIGMFCIGMAVMLIAIHAKHSIILLFVTAVFFVGNFVLTIISIISNWNIFRFLNFNMLIRPHDIFGRYLNLNIFGNPVNLIPVFITFLLLIFTTLIFIVCISFVKKRGLESNLELLKFKKFNIIPRFLHTNYKFFEFKKLVFTNKALYIIIAFMLLQGYQIYNSEAPYLGYEHYYKKNTLIALQGPLNDEKEKFILDEKNKYDYAEAEIEKLKNEYARNNIELQEMIEAIKPYETILNKMSGFLEIYERYEYVRDSKNAQFLYDTGYTRLFGMEDTEAGLTSGMWMCAMLILCLCGVFSIEYKTGMFKILNSTTYGYVNTAWIKLFISVGLALIVFILTYLPDLIFTGRFFGFAGINLPLASIYPTHIGGFPDFMGRFPVWSYIVLLLMLRFIVCVGIVLIVLALSLAIRNNVYAALFGTGILLLPLFIHIFGIDLFNTISLLEIITANGLIVAASPIKILQLIIFIFASCICGCFIIRRFGTINPIRIKN